jgi:O-6-methylguanine DNA methyltransferase
MRSTPQRRAILAAFAGGAAEHLSADEVYARAAESLPELSRGTVYATLAEFTEAGLLASFGTPEPVRYETNTEAHAHFRCRLCLRIFDVVIEPPDPGPFERHGFHVERMDLRAEGVCKECDDYQAGLRAGARGIARSGASADSLEGPGAAAAEIDSPLGPLLIAATPSGVARLAFAEHADAQSVRALALNRRSHNAARAHVRAAAEQLAGYFSGDPAAASCEIDWAALRDALALQAALAIPYGVQRSYSDLGLELPARELGRVYGANPIPILVPCHRVTRGAETPGSYVGGVERRRWLLEHEREHSKVEAR